NAFVAHIVGLRSGSQADFANCAPVGVAVARFCWAGRQPGARTAYRPEASSAASVAVPASVCPILVAVSRGTTREVTARSRLRPWSASDHQVRALREHR